MSMRLFVFLFWGILKRDFWMRIFVFLVSALLNIDFWMRVFVFWCQAYWKLIFQWKCLFFGFRPIENCFFNENLCFLGLRHCGRRCCALFPNEFTMLLAPALFLQWECLFFGLRPIENRIFEENLCFLVSDLLKMDFSMRVFVFLVKGLLKIVFSLKVFVFGSFSMRVFVFLGLRPIENWFFNESVGFCGFSHCGRRCCALFFKWILSVFKTQIIFSMRVFVFWSQAFWKLIFRWEYLRFWSKVYWKLIFQWKSLFFWVWGLLKMDFSMKVFVS